MSNSTGKFRSFHLLSGLSAIVGVTMLVISFAINNRPALGSSDEEFVRFVRESYAAILWGAWLQAVGPVFIMIFAFALIHLAGHASKLSGWMTFFGGSTLMMVNLMEITFYISGIHAKPVFATRLSALTPSTPCNISISLSLRQRSLCPWGSSSCDHTFFPER
ncbi:MAG TPA: hypothetical protein VGM27_26880 [Acidobacteriaceae bacterium]